MNHNLNLQQQIPLSRWHIRIDFHSSKNVLKVVENSKIVYIYLLRVLLPKISVFKYVVLPKHGLSTLPFYLLMKGMV